MAELDAFHTTFGGEGEGDGYSDSGCLALLVLGIIFFLYSSVHLAILYIQEMQQQQK